MDVVIAWSPHWHEIQVIDVATKLPIENITSMQITVCVPKQTTVDMFIDGELVRANVVGNFD